jgi:hypothetical protein
MRTITRTVGRLKYIEPNDLAALYGVKSVNGMSMDTIYDVVGRTDKTDIDNEVLHKYYPDNVSWNPEDLNMSVDLQVVMPSREDCGQISFNQMFAVEINNNNSSAIGKYVSFLQGSDITKSGQESKEHELTTSYADASYMQLCSEKESNKESLGIESIDITFDSHFYPQVNIKFIDVRGYSLMMPTESQYRESLLNQEGDKGYSTTYNNFFRALFHFPYPRFLLTIKGYYGNSITFILAVNEFKNNFNSSTGNFEVNVSFIGYMYGLYTDIPFNFLICAPYYGLSADEGDSHATGDYWQNGDYKFDDTNESPMCTFIDFIERCDKLNKLKKDLDDGSTDDSELNEVSKLSDDIDTVRGIIDNTTKFLKDIISNNENSKMHFIKRTDSSGRLTQVGVFSDTDRLYFNKDAYNAFVDKYNEWKSGDKILDVTGDKDWAIPEDFRADDGDWIKKDNAFVTLHTEFGDDTNIPDIEDHGILAKMKADSNKGKTYYGIVYCDSFIKMLEDYVTNARKKISEKSKATQTNLTDKYIKALGFDPTVQNIFRMIFAHIDCFMDGFYTMLGEIKNSNRKLSDIGIVADKDLTDLNRYSDKDCFVPPFTAFYKKEDNKRVEIYPGETEEGKKLKEVDYVEHLLSGALAAKKSAKRYIEDATNNSNYSDENSAARNTEGQDFILTSLTDTVFNGVNPYSYYNEQPSNKYFFGGLLYYFALRYAQSKFQLGGMDLGNADIEAANFIKLHSEPPSDLFKQTVSKYAGSDSSDILSPLSDYISNNNGLVAPVTISNDKVSISESVLPLFTKGVKELSSGKILYSQKNNSESLLKTMGADHLSDINKIVSAISSGSYGGDGATLFSDRIVARPSEYNETAINGINNGWSSAISEESTCRWIDESKRSYDSFLHLRSKSAKEQAANFLYCLIYDLAKNDDTSYSGGATVTLSTVSIKRTIRINAEFSKTGICSMYSLTAAFIGAILNGEYGSSAEENGRLVFMQSFDAKSSSIEYSVDTDQYKYIKEHFKDKFVKAFTDFVKGSGDFTDRSWKKITNIANYETNSQGIYTKLKAELRYEIVNKLLKSKYFYLYNVEDENSGSSIDIPISDFQIFVAKLNSQYSAKKSLEEQEANNVDESDISTAHKLAAYNALKNLYDKWANSYSIDDFKLRSPSADKQAKQNRYVSGTPQANTDVKEFDNFVFVDSFYNDISGLFRINPDTVYKIITDQINNECNYSTYEFMADICQKNRLLFLALPVLNNFYTDEGLENIFKPQPENTMKLGYGSTYVCMYTYEVSHILEDESQTSLCDDGFDIAGITGDESQTTASLLFSENGNGLKYSVPSFGVTYARQNQQYFKTINVNMDNPRITDYSIANLFELSNFKNDGSLQKPYTIANDVYSIYANRSYNCSVEMLGCANIMPMMYFQLNNIPMFRGAYMITNVEHHITAGNFTTQFTGVRISKNQLPYNDEIFNLASMLNLNGDSDSYEGNSSGSNDDNTDCDGFDVNKAIESMHSSFTCSEGTVIPYNNANSMSCCTTATGTFIKAGGLNIASSDGRIGFIKPALWSEKLISVGFELKKTFADGSTINERVKWVKANGLKGDVCVMHRAARDWSNGGGHVCMYAGGGIWVSDFNHQKNGVAPYNPYVYNSEESIFGKASQEIYIYRFKGCSGNNSSSSSNEGGIPTYSGNMNEKQRGKYIMQYMKSTLGFTNEQVIGVAAGLRQESMTSQGGWNPAAINEDSKSAGIAQWYKSRVSKIVGYVNDKFGKNYTKTANGIASMTLEEQCYALCKEVKDTTYAKSGNIYNGRTYEYIIKQQSTAENALQAWIVYFERSDASWTTYKKSIPKAREALNS